MGKAEDKLAELLEVKEQELSDLKEQIEQDLEDERWRWTRHVEMPKDMEQTLPVPRLEIWLNPDESDDYNRCWVYRMIYRHLLGHCVAVPLGQTKQSGGNPNSAAPLIDFMPVRACAHIRHDAKAFGWPAFMVRGDESEIIPLEPSHA